MRVNLKIFVLTFLAAFLAAPLLPNAATDQETRLYNQAVECRQKLRNSATYSRKEDNWVQCANKFKLVYLKNPETRLADNILLDAGEIYLGLYAKTKKAQHLKSALNSFRELYYYYPLSRLAAQATLNAGDIYFKQLKKYRQAYGAYSRLLEFYGTSDAADVARKRLKELATYYAPPENGNNFGSNMVKVNDIRHWTNPRYTRVVIDLDGRVRYRNEVIKNPDRLFIDLHGARMTGKSMGQRLSINDGLLKRVRMAQYNRNTVRVVLDIDHIERYKIFELDNPFRVIIDVSGNARKKSSSSGAGSKRSRSKNGKEKLSLARQLGLGIETVVIDPGHGGKDPGAIGRSGVKEKDIVLDISKRLKKIIEEGTGRRAYLTRYTDVFLPLEERTAIANTLEADLFISIHINANAVPAVRGVETYYLSLATTVEEQEIAARENRTSFKKISDLQDILSSMMLNSKIEESKALAGHVQSSMIKGLRGKYRTRNLGVKKAPFYVLIGAQMPSVLVEVSFITNSEEEKLLTSSSYRQAVALQIYKGLESYIAKLKAFPSLAAK